MAHYKLWKLEDLKIGADYDQDKIDRWLLTKVRPLPSNWKVLTVTSFIKMVSKFIPYSISK